MYSCLPPPPSRPPHLHSSFCLLLLKQTLQLPKKLHRCCSADSAFQGPAIQSAPQPGTNCPDEPDLPRIPSDCPSIPAARRPNPAALSVVPMPRRPNGAGTRRQLPASRNPDVEMVVVFPITWHPDGTAARRHTDDLRSQWRRRFGHRRFAGCPGNGRFAASVSRLASGHEKVPQREQQEKLDGFSFHIEFRFYLSGCLGSVRQGRLLQPSSMVETTTHQPACRNSRRWGRFSPRRSL